MCHSNTTNHFLSVVKWNKIYGEESECFITSLKGSISLWCWRGFWEVFNSFPMMLIYASLSKSCTPDCCTFLHSERYVEITEFLGINNTRSPDWNFIQFCNFYFASLHNGATFEGSLNYNAVMFDGFQEGFKPRPHDAEWR